MPIAGTVPGLAASRNTRRRTGRDIERGTIAATGGVGRFHENTQGVPRDAFFLFPRFVLVPTAQKVSRITALVRCSVCRPAGARCFCAFLPTAYAVGYSLSPLRG